ncbi:hemolysin family protein [Flavihumibacter cheonanensis]|nr:hemolysin family protein [Flavihumibacter cheonanensis]
MQIGITLIGILTGIYSGEKITEDVKAFISSISFLQPYADTVSVAVVLIVLTFFSIVFGELIPKRIGLMFPETIAKLVAQPMNLLSVITKPFIWLLTITNNFFLGLFGLKNKEEGIVSEEEIKAIIQDSTDSGEIQEIEQDIVERVFALGDRKVNELMTHRSDLVYMDYKDELTEIARKISEEPHSVYPVIQGSLDKIKGVISVKDLFPVICGRQAFEIDQFIRQPLYLHGSTPAYRVLEKFRKEKMHVGLVIDEYGALEGLVTMDDILDALVGDVTEYNQAEYAIIETGLDQWVADGQYSYFEFLHFFSIEETDQDSDFNTLGGFLLQELDHIPAVGEKLNWNGLGFEILEMDHLRIEKIRIKKLS